jgi:hypothetical protein
MLLCALSGFAGPNSPVVGKWDCVSRSDATGMEVAWSMFVSADGEKLSGYAVFKETGDRIDLADMALHENTLTFKVVVNAEETVELTGRIDGARIEGTFKGKAAGTGTFKGSRQG